MTVCRHMTLAIDFLMALSKDINLDEENSKRLYSNSNDVMIF